MACNGTSMHTSVPLPTALVKHPYMINEGGNLSLTPEALANCCLLLTSEAERLQEAGLPHPRLEVKVDSLTVLS